MTFQTCPLLLTCQNMGEFLAVLLPVVGFQRTNMEYGLRCRCITSPPRLWQEVGSLYSAPTTNVFSGGIAFSYFPTSDGYGMVTFEGTDGQT